MLAPGSARPVPSLRFRRLRALALLVALVAVTSAGVQAVGDGLSDGVAASTSRHPAAGPAAPSAAEALSQTVQDWKAESGSRLAVAVADLGSGTGGTYGDVEHAFATASIVKVDILATLLLQRGGHLSAAQRALARRMIRASDNAAASALWRQIGRAGGLAAANARFGLQATVGGRGGWWGRSTTTATDQLRLLRIIFTDDSPLSEQSRRYVRTLMGSVLPDQDWGVSAADTRSGSRYFVKNGWLPRGGGWVVNSIGLVEHSGHPLLLVALTDGGRTKTESVQIVELTARDAAQAVTGG